MKFAKIENGVITQINLRATEGFVEVPKSVVCGQIQQGNAFVNPPPTPQPEDEPSPLLVAIADELKITDEKKRKEFFDKATGKK